MAGKLVRMSKIKQVLQLHQQGRSNRQIALDLGLYKATVNDYIRKVRSNGFDINHLLRLEDPVLEKKFSAGTPAYTEERFEVLKDQLDYFDKELTKKGVTKALLWEEYLQDHPDGYRYSQFCYHLSQLQSARHPTAILEHLAGEKLYIDFAGKPLSYINRDAGEVIYVQVFVACLPYSDYTFAIGVPSQKTDDFLYALSCALTFFGGSPKILVPDNLKGAVTKADKYEPELNLVMEDFANHYGFVVIPARPYKAKDKAAVENHVRIIYNRVYARLRNNIFYSLQELNRAIEEKIHDHNQTRMQQKNYSRQEKFLAEEKAALKALPQKGFELKYYTDLRVANNNCIYLGRDKHYYSVPYRYIGQKVSVIYTRTLVQIYCKNECIATHLRSIGFGYTTQKDHLCSTHNHYLSRSPEYYINQARKYSPGLTKIVEMSFESNQVPEVIYKRCDGLLSLQRNTDPAVFERACEYAIECGLFSYKSLQNIIQNKSYELYQPKQIKQEPVSHQNIRGREYYINQLSNTPTLWNKSEQN